MATGQQEILEHEILGVLYHKGTLTIIGTGNQKSGHRLLDAEIATAPMHYGGIVALLNNPQKFEKPADNRDVNYYQNLEPTSDEIEKTPMKYSRRNITDTLDILESRGEIIFMDEASLNMEQRRIQLSKAGKISYKTKKYLREKDEDEFSVKLAKSQIDTNAAIVLTGKWTRYLFYATLAMAIATFILAITPYINDSEKHGLQQQLKEKDSLIRQLQNRQFRHSDPNQDSSKKK